MSDEEKLSFEDILKDNRMRKFLENNYDVMLEATRIFGLEAVKFASAELKCNSEFMVKAMKCSNDVDVNNNSFVKKKTR